MSEFFRMGGYGFYVWSSYGMLALAIAVELWQLKRRRGEARQRAREAAEEIFT
jgi:heme exporter protein D